MNDVLEKDSVEQFLTHYGVKGQQWGHRKAIFAKARKGDWRTRSGGQKVGLVAGGYFGAGVAGGIVRKLMARHVKTPEGLAAMGAVTIGANIIGAKYGARLTRNLLQKHGKKPMKQIRKLQRQPLSEDESIRRVQQYVDGQNRRR